MKRDFDAPILNIDGQPVRVGDSAQAIAKAVSSVWKIMPKDVQDALNAALAKEAGKPLTLGDACVSVLMGAYPDEPGLSLPERAKRMKLALRITEGGVQDIEPEDRDLIKPLLIKGYNGPLVPVRCAELLEKDAPEPLKSVA